ncbi:hypothetical protein IMY05_009G0086000 [Salix suchowensis]|nr:hypothetical protein IMY05_009G0086000 [Salix suchowensis]
MVIRRLEMCIVLVKLAMELIMAVAEAIGIFIQQNGSAAPLANRLYTAPVPFVGFLHESSSLSNFFQAVFLHLWLLCVHVGEVCRW